MMEPGQHRTRGTLMVNISTRRLADVFVEAADTLVDEYDLIEFLQMVTNRTAEITGASDVGLLLADQRGQLQFVAASNETVKALEIFQIQNHEGPCLDAFQSGQPVVDTDMADAAARWPVFAPRAATAGYRSVHALPMRLRSDVIGAMGIFGTESSRLGRGDMHIVQALADVATIGLLQERAIHRAEILSEQLQAALNSRIVIEQAKGAVAQLHHVSVDDAFLMLRHYARSSQRRLGDVAHQVLADPSSLAGLELVRPADPSTTPDDDERTR